MRTTPAPARKIIPTAEEIFAKADMIVKVKEPQAVERKMLRPGQILYTYLHLAPDPEQTKDLVASGAVCIAYETVTSARGGLPLLAPMSQVAGRMSVQSGAHCLEKAQGGRGVLLGGVPGVAPAKVVILGGGVVGTNAARGGARHGCGRDHPRKEHRPHGRTRRPLRHRRSRPSIRRRARWKMNARRPTSSSAAC